MISRPLFLAVVALVLAGCGNSAPVPPDLWREFSGDRAFDDAAALVQFGPRPPGSEGIERSRQFIESRLRDAGWTVARQVIEAPTPHGPVTFVNLIARWSPSGKPARADSQQWIVASHYDTKIFKEFEFTGANDGASSSGALIELARVLAAAPAIAARFELVFFDGEECFVAYSDTDGLYGSRHYARALARDGRASQFKAAFVWDMIGDRDLNITLPADSPPVLARAILASAAALGHRDRFSLSSQSILDDHVPLQKAGIPAIDVIDFDFPHWHTKNDTIDKISPESIAIVGRTTLHAILQEMSAAGTR